MAPITRSNKSNTASTQVMEKKTPKVIRKKQVVKKKATDDKRKNKDSIELQQEEEINVKTEKKEETKVVEKKPTKKNKKENDTVEDDSNANVKTEKKEETKVVEKKPTKKNKKENDIVEDDLNANLANNAKTIYEFTVEDIDGNKVSLEKYKGHVCIILNVASRCGHTTSNYQQLVQLYEKYSDSHGLRILAFPCNQFGSQESGTCEKIKAFAEKKGVKFDMFTKINVNGPKAEPLWIYLKEMLPEVTSGKATGKDIKWNFTKFIIDKNGVPVERYPSSTKPVTLEEKLESLF